MNRRGAPHRLGRSFGETEVTHLALFDQPRHLADRLLDGSVRVYAVLVVEVDYLDAQTPQRRLARRAHVLGPTRDAEEAPVLAAHVPELRRQHDAVAPVAYRAPDQLLVAADAVHVGRVEKVDAQLQ